MELVSLEEFSTSLFVDEQDPEGSIWSYIVLNRWKTRKLIKGIVLEQCIRIYGYYLVFMTYDCPYEEALTVSLLDKNGNLLETEDIFDPTYTDSFSGLTLYPPNIVTFDFLYVDLWKIEVLRMPRPLRMLEIWAGILKKNKYRTETYWKVSWGEERPSLSSK